MFAEGDPSTVGSRGDDFTSMHKPVAENLSQLLDVGGFLCDHSAAPVSPSSTVRIRTKLDPASRRDTIPTSFSLNIFSGGDSKCFLSSLCVKPKVSDEYLFLMISSQSRVIKLLRFVPPLAHFQSRVVRKALWTGALFVIFSFYSFKNDVRLFVCENTQRHTNSILHRLGLFLSCFFGGVETLSARVLHAMTSDALDALIKPPAH